MFLPKLFKEKSGCQQNVFKKGAEFSLLLLFLSLTIFLLIKDMMHMKKKMKVLIALVCLGAVYLVTKEMENKPISDLAFQNIEALAQGEGFPENFYCINAGDIDCYGHKVEDKYTGFSLRPDEE